MSSMFTSLNFQDKQRTNDQLNTIIVDKVTKILELDALLKQMVRD